MSHGPYTTIPKALCGGSIDQEEPCFLNVVDVDIAFGDCIAPGGFCYALISMDCATRYNWVFGLKDLSSNSILLAFCLFQGDADLYAWYFWSDCNTKLFSTKICKFLLESNSNIVAAVASWQSANGCVESHWKIMVHMSRAYLTKEQMPRSFWFYSVVHLAHMMNAIPGKFGGKLALPFMLVHGVGHDKRAWFPLFLGCCFHHV